MRNVIEKFLHPKNEHDRLLAAWMSVQQGAAVVGFCVLCSLCKCVWERVVQSEPSAPCGPAELLLLQFICFSLFAITHFRFSQGDQRYVGDVYLAKVARGKKAAHHLRRDLQVFIGQAVIFTGMASNIMDALVFFIFFQALLLYDIPWLAHRYRLCVKRPADGLAPGVLTIRRRCSENLLRWLTNNATTAFVMIMLLVFYGLDWIGTTHYLWLSALASFTNCVVDLVMTRDVYKKNRSQGQA